MYDVAIIGGGPAGASAAVFTAKANQQTLLCDDADGATQYAWVRNHYGVEDIEGADLVDIGLHQAEKFGAKVVKTRVTDINVIDNGYQVVTDKGNFEAHQVLFATGEAIELAAGIGLDLRPASERVGSEQVIATDAAGHTSRQGIWAAGMVAGSSPHTIITAGDGARVAVNLLSELSGKRHVDHDVSAGT